MASFLICATTGYFADDVPARCAACDAPIVHRPHVDPSHVKICERCAFNAWATGKPVTVHVTEDTRRELALFYAKTTGGPQ